MKVSKAWLQELVDIKNLIEVERLLPLRTIALKDINDHFFELDMKGYNRADLLSMRGVAYEVAAITDSKVNFVEPDADKFAWVGEDLPQVNVQVENQDLAPLYCIAKIEGLKVETSPSDWVQKLSDCGMRSVNNIADITNLVMLEYGQPLHSFDARAVKDQTIIVRTAQEGERIVTLDQKSRDLQTTDLLITDPEKALGIAGVIGGKDSEIIDSTTTILLEAAIFEPGNLRKTSTRLGLQSEASKRFYHGLTKKRLLQALDAAIKMYQDLDGQLTALTIVGQTEDQVKKVNLRLAKVNSLIGVEISKDQVEDYLKKLNFTFVIASEQGERRDLINDSNDNKIAMSATPPRNDISWEVTPPYWRLDIEIEEDLIEEVARMYGYEKIPAKPLDGVLPEKIDQSLFNLIYELKTKLVEQGFTELQTYSYFSTQVLNNFNSPKEQLIKIANPISAETEYLRDNLWNNLVEKTAENLKYFETVAVFEIGKTYEVVDGKIVEEYRLALALANGTDNPLANLYQVIAKVLTTLSLKEGGAAPNLPYFHPNRHQGLINQDQQVGGMAEVHPRILDKFGLNKRVAIAEVKLSTA